MLKSIFDRLLETLYPPRCVFCDTICPGGQTVCLNCQKYKTPDLFDICLNSGDRIRSFHYRFDGCTAPYYYAGSVSRAIRSMKFHGKKELTRQLGYLIAQKVKMQYIAIDFDYAVYVPLNKSGYKERTYDQSRLLAKQAGRCLKIPVLDGLLLKSDNCKIQHDLDFKDRWYNTRDAFSISDKYDTDILRGKTLLLIDDICTTGATLDSCSRVLKSAGANKVYCAAAAFSKYRAK